MPRPMGEPTLEELAAAVARGDRAALRGIWERTAPRLFREVLAPILRDRAACEDALEETFVSVLERPAALAAGEVFPYLATIARNKALDRLRRAGSESRLREAVAKELLRAEEAAPDPAAEALAREAHGVARERVAGVLARMHPRYAEAIRLRLLEDRSREACAAALAVKVGTFDVVLFRACKQFRALYVESHGPEGGGVP